uniref:Mobile element protein n=1 Tax=Heterorhabditis bacteriophora TaxID=37862 RepID=A0A1I7WNM4_HETBA
MLYLKLLRIRNYPSKRLYSVRKTLTLMMVVRTVLINHIPHNY